MSGADAPARYTIAANLRWFAVAYALVTLALIGASLALAAYDVDVPWAANIGTFIGLVMLAGTRFAEKNGDWNSRLRSQLALRYVATAIAVSLFFALVFAGVSFAIEPARIVQSMILLKWSIPYLAVAAAIVLLAYYFGARMVLAFAAKQRDRNAWQTPSGGEKTP